MMESKPQESLLKDGSRDSAPNATPSGTLADAPDNALLNGTPPEPWRFRLYIAGSAPHSRLALHNLKVIGDMFLKGNYLVELVDVLKEPGRTLEDQIYVTPTLLRLSPEPLCRIIGNLSDQKRVLFALGLEETLNGTSDR